MFMAEKENNQPESMEDILSSIRETVEGEAKLNPEERSVMPADEAEEDVVAKAAEEETATAPDETAKEAEAVPAEEESDALDLSDMLEEDAAPAEPAPKPTQQTANGYNETEEVIDIDAFNQTGEEKTAEDEKAANARALYRGEEMPEETAETEEEPTPEQTEEVKEEKEEVAAEPAEEKQPEVQEEPETQEEVEVAKEEIAEAATQVVAQSITTSADAVHLPTTPSADGLQVTFPVEVLATALRPLVKDWVNQNLPAVVEKLVKEELEKLANQ
jgi:cell pole-organizing protein PopZ